MSEETFIKLADILQSQEDNYTIQIQPQDANTEQNKLQQVKFVLLGYKGRIKNFINTFELYDDCTATIHEFLHSKEDILETLNLNSKIPIIEIELSNNVSAFFTFSASKQTAIHTEIPSACISGSFTFELYYINNSRDVHSDPRLLLEPISYTFINKNQLLEDLIAYLLSLKI